MPGCFLRRSATGAQRRFCAFCGVVEARPDRGMSDGAENGNLNRHSGTLGAPALLAYIYRTKTRKASSNVMPTGTQMEERQ